MDDLILVRRDLSTERAEQFAKAFEVIFQEPKEDQTLEEIQEELDAWTTVVAAGMFFGTETILRGFGQRKVTIHPGKIRVALSQVTRREGFAKAMRDAILEADSAVRRERNIPADNRGYEG